MIVVTGGFGFIGSCIIWDLFRNGYQDIVAVDDFTQVRKVNNLKEAKVERVSRSAFFQWLEKKENEVDYIIHMGARTDTTEQNETIFEHLNLEYSKKIFEYCSDFQVPLIYASSAATYGDGSLGYRDNHALIPRLEPLNPYGWSKQYFDLWVINRGHQPPNWQGLKFFNVYGPNEYHKGRMASVIFHAYNQIRENGRMKLFRSHREDYKDGQQSRDFIYIKDVIQIIRWMMEHQEVPNGIYNVGTGLARSFEDLTLATFHAMGISPLIDYIDTPEDIRDNYQYFTQANMEKIINTGYVKQFTSLEDGVTDYVKHYLMKGKYF